jgi:hypothetical protein
MPRSAVAHPSGLLGCDVGGSKHPFAVALRRRNGGYDVCGEEKVEDWRTTLSFHQMDILAA